MWWTSTTGLIVDLLQIAILWMFVCHMLSTLWEHDLTDMPYALRWCMCRSSDAISLLYAVPKQRGFLLELMLGEQQMLVMQQLLLFHVHRMAHHPELQLTCIQHAMLSKTAEVTFPKAWETRSCLPVWKPARTRQLQTNHLCSCLSLNLMLEPPLQRLTSLGPVYLCQS